MDAERLRRLVRGRAGSGFDVYERRSGKYQLILPIRHEDGDMVDVYLTASPKGGGHVRICDYGMALTRLSYTYDPSTPARRRILESILIDNDVRIHQGNLHLDIPADLLLEGILQFAGCVRKVCNMRYWSRAITHSAFYDDLTTHITSELEQFSPVADHDPLPGYPINVDWLLTHNDRRLFLFGVRGSNKAKNAAIALLEFQKAQLEFISLIVHDDMSDLGRKEVLFLTRNADRQYPVLDDFRQRASDDICRIAGTAA